MDKQSVLVIDDEPINIRVVADSLEGRYTVIVATSGANALRILEQQIPDLLLLDIHMPQMDGFEVIERLRGNPKLAKIPVIFLTADDSEETIVRAFNAGAVDYITKPFLLKELDVRVDNQIRAYTLQKNLNSSLEINTRLLTIIDSYVSFVRVDMEGSIQEISTNFCSHLGCVREELVGENINILKSGYTPLTQYQELWESIKAGQTFVHEIEDRNFSGGTNWYRVTISPSIDDDQQANGYIAIYENIDEKMRFKKSSETDLLTSLPNRSKIDEFLTQEEARANRFNHTFSVILVDIDHFKEVNDEYGHQEGDKVLKAFAEILSSNIRLSDFIGRWGGEEFLIICPNTDEKGAAILAENLRQTIEEYEFPRIGQKTASFGIAQYVNQESLEQLFSEVDNALYAAKFGGRNQVKVYEK